MSTMNNPNTLPFLVTYRKQKSVNIEVEEYISLDEAQQRVEVLKNVTWANARTVTLYKQV